jgi:serine/threonine protein kinase
MPETMKDPPGTLGKYSVIDVVGEGAMGVVYKAVDPVIRRTVAIKSLRPGLIEPGREGADLLARFRREAQAAGRLMHPGIVTIYDYGEDARSPYIVMEYVEGHTLMHHLKSGRRFEDAEVVQLMNQLLDALHHAHLQGVWHRDIKPSNLILTPEGQLKIADFGVARIETSGPITLTANTGTPGHMAPEQYSGQRVDHRVDIFASGVLLYQLLTSCSPFGGSYANVMFETMNNEPMPPSQVCGSPDREPFDAVVGTAMAKQREDRYASARDFKHALNQAAARAILQAAPLHAAPGSLQRPDHAGAASPRQDILRMQQPRYVPAPHAVEVGEDRRGSAERWLRPIS